MTENNSSFKILLTIIRLQKPAFMYAERLEVTHCFCKQTLLLVRDWLQGFWRATSRAISANIITEFNRGQLTKFDDNQDDIPVRSCEQTYNTDEAGFRTVANSGKFLAEKARKRVDTAASWETRRNTTVACVMTATASFTHPVFNHPKQKPEYYTKKTWASGVSLPMLKHRLDHRTDDFALALKPSIAAITR